MSGPDPGERHHSLVRARCALGIVHAQYWRALTLAETGEPGERAAALAEARRLLEMAVALRRRGDALQSAESAGGLLPERERPSRREPGRHPAGLRAALSRRSAWSTTNGAGLTRVRRKS